MGKEKRGRNMQKFEIGKPYQAGVTKIPEGIVFDFSQAGGFLRIVFNAPTREELREIKKGKIKLGLLEKDGIIFFFIKFGELYWMDAPYNIAFSKPYEFGQLADENSGYAVQIVLVDGKTGIIKAIKLIGLPHELSVKFRDMVQKQKKAPVKDFDSVLSRIYTRYLTGDLIQEAETYTF